MKLIWLSLVSFFAVSSVIAQSELVNVFLGSSGDHGQLSPAASYPFGMMSICPQTYPNGHTGYEHKAKTILGITHNRFEGVGCMGSGGNILITPFSAGNSPLIKQKESARPGHYAISFTNGISTTVTVNSKSGLEKYHFPSGNNGFVIDLSHTLANAFRKEQHNITKSSVSGWIESGTTCSMGTYRLYYYLGFDRPVALSDSTEHLIYARFAANDITLRIGFSSVSAEKAEAEVYKQSFDEMLTSGRKEWNLLFSRISVSGNPEEEKLFYSLLYRALQSPYRVSDASEIPLYNGWSIWDNYKTQLPLLSLAYPEQYKHIVRSIAALYPKGKKNWATDHEPSNSVRTEHASVVLLDAYRKGYFVDFNLILDSLIREMDSLKFDRPDRALESCYDLWAMGEILSITEMDSLSNVFRNKAKQWVAYWAKDFKDLSKKDVDALPARGMYQGTIWQYRWLVPYDLEGLIEQCGGEKNYIDQLNTFFGNDYYNAANETDIQVPYMYNATRQPWKSQEIIHKYVHDTVVQYYFNDNSRGIDPYIGRVYNNRPDSYLRTMDDDGGAMSGWYVLAAIGLSPACVGHPVWYVHVPLFQKIVLRPGKQVFVIEVRNFGKENKYIQSINLNGEMLDRVWLTHDEIKDGGKLLITAGAMPNKNFGIKNIWVSGNDE